MRSYCEGRVHRHHPRAAYFVSKADYCGWLDVTPFSTRHQRKCATAATQATANYQFMPLPRRHVRRPRDKAFRVAPRWATLSPEQGVLDAGSSIDVNLQIHVFGGPQGCAEALATSQVCCSRMSTLSGVTQSTYVENVM